jgi:hypothetical protein
MVLNADHERVVLDLYDLHEAALGVGPTDDESSRLQI